MDMVILTMIMNRQEIIYHHYREKQRTLTIPVSSNLKKDSRNQNCVQFLLPNFGISKLCMGFLVAPSECSFPAETVQFAGSWA